MPISNESKNALANEIEKLQIQKQSLNKRIQELIEKKDFLVSRRVEINSQISKLQADSV